MLKEAKVPVTTEEAPVEVAESNGQTNGKGVDNMAFQEAPTAQEANKPAAPVVAPLEVTPEEGEKKHFLVEFFNPTLALACIEVVRKKREQNKHILIWFLVVSYIIIAGTVQGGSPADH